jgi:hypothetical protein
MYRKFCLVVLVICFVASVTQASLIVSVNRSRGQSGDRAPIGVFTGDTDPLPTEPGGLKDGNIIYSDRTYPWINTPAQLIGIEYVRTFNNDKATSEIMVSYDVTISAPAILGITMDDRIPASWSEVTGQAEAVWLATHTWAPPGTFADTGLDLYIKESDTTFRPMSVWATTGLMPAGTYRFGLNPANQNFYTIGAIPEPATVALLGLGALALVRRKK